MFFFLQLLLGILTTFSGGRINECSIFFDILNHLRIIFILGQIAFVPDNYQQAFGTCKLKKILKQVEYESARRKRHINEKKKKR